MKTLTDVEKKEHIAATMKDLTERMNEQIELANKLLVTVQVRQNPPFGANNAYVCVSVYETIGY